MICLPCVWVQRCCTELFDTFAPDQLNGSVTQLNRKTRSDHCSRQLFIQGHGSGIAWIVSCSAVLGCVLPWNGRRTTVLMKDHASVGTTFFLVKINAKYTITTFCETFLDYFHVVEPLTKTETTFFVCEDQNTQSPLFVKVFLIMFMWLNPS